MMEYAYAPSAANPPDLFMRYLFMKEFGIGWEDTGPPLSLDEIALVAQLVSVWNQAQALKSGVRSR